MAEILHTTSTCPNLLPMKGRSPGTHISTLIHRLALRANMYEARELNMAKVQEEELRANWEMLKREEGRMMREMEGEGEEEEKERIS